MNLLLDDLEELLQTHDENECIEFKEAKADFSFDKLAKYCAALSNEGGGRLILGVTDKKPRMIVGTQAFADLNRCKLSLAQKLRQRIDIQEWRFLKAASSFFMLLQGQEAMRLNMKVPIGCEPAKV